MRCLLLHIACVYLILTVHSTRSIRERLGESRDDVPDADGDVGDQSQGSSHLRRRLNEEHSAPSSSDVGPLTRSLRRDWAKGKINSRQVQEYGFGAQQQGATGLSSISRAGNYGSHPSSIHRALMNFFGKPVGAPDLDYIEVPCRTSRGTRPHPFLLPHKFFHGLYKERPRCWEKYMTGLPSAALDFWTNIAHTPFVKKKSSDDLPWNVQPSYPHRTSRRCWSIYRS